MTRPLRKITRLHALSGKQLAIARPRKGDTIGAFVARERLADGLPTVVAERIGTELQPIPRRDWDRRIRTRDHLVLLSRPMGGGGGGGGQTGSQQIGSIVGLVALLAIAGPLGGAAALGGLIGGGATATAIASALIIGGGSILISHFLGASRPKPNALEYTVDITSNQARSQQPIPCQYGRVKFFPDLAAPTFSDYSGTDQTFHAIYSIGVGEYDFEEVGFGLTPVWTAANGTAAGFPTFKIEGVPPNVDSNLFPTDVATSGEVSGQTLPDPYGSKYVDGSQLIGPNGETSGINWVGGFVANPPGTQATRIGIDLVWPSGLYYTVRSSGNQHSLPCLIECQYRPVDDQGVPTGAGTWLVGFDKTYTFNSKVPVRLTEFISPSAYGRFEVRVGRRQIANGATNVDTCTWSALKTYLTGPNAVPYTTRMAIELTADKQLSTYSSTQLYVIATRKIPVYNSSTGTFVTQNSKNPIWAAVDVWNNADYGANLPYTGVDLPTMLALAAAADARGDCFNYRFTAQSTIFEAISKCLAPMLTQPVFFAGQFSAVRDQQRPFPKMMLTDFEISRGSLELAYTLKDVQTSDGVILQYTEEQTWKPAEVSSVAAGTVLLQPTRITQDGNTNRRQAVVAARYHAAVNNYRRKTATLEIEADGRLLRRGDLVSVQSELPQAWGQALRADFFDAVNTIITADAPADWSVSGVHYVKIRTPSGGQFGPVACSMAGGNPSQIYLDPTDRARVEAQQGITWLQAVSRGPLQAPASLELGVGTPLSFQGLVSGISHGSAENTFKLELVYDAPEVYTIDTLSVPALPEPSPIVLPTVPGEILNIHAYEQQSGTSMVLYASWDPEPVSINYTAQVSFDNGATWPNVAYSGFLASFSYPGMPSGTPTMLRIRGTAFSGANGPWTVVSLASPEIDLTPSNLGYQVGYYDIAPTIPDAAIAAALLEADAFVQMVGQAKLTTTAQVQANFANYQLATVVVDLTDTVAQANATLTGSIRTEAGIRLTEDTVIATSVTVLTATVATNAATAAAAITQEAETRATADTAQASVVTALTSTVTTNAAAATSAINQEAATRSTADSALATTINQVQASLTTTNANLAAEATTRQTADASATSSIASLAGFITSNYNSLASAIQSEASTRASADSSLAQQITTLTASSAAGTASGSIAWTTSSSPISGVSAQYNLTLSASGATATQTGLYLEALSDGTSRVVITAAQFQIQNAANRAVPFAIDGTGTVYLQGVTKVTSTISSTALTTGGSTPGVPVMAQDFVNGSLSIWDNS